MSRSFSPTSKKRIEQDERITVHLGTTVANTEGFVGNFKTTLADAAVFDHGAIVVTSGGAEYTPVEYGYGSSAQIMTQRELESWLAANAPKGGDRFVMIQCVGSREEPANYCSRICCQDALKNSIAIKERQPDAQVVVLYRDLRSYGLKEEYYKKARDLGVLFFLYVPERKPEVVPDGNGFKVRIDGKVLGGEMEIEADYLILSNGLRPQEDAQALAQTYKLTRNSDGYFMEAHVKLRPVDFASEGLFLAGLAHAPKNLEETISQALAAAGRAGTLLSRDSLTVSSIIAKHNRDICMSCLACFRACPFGSPFIDEDGRVSHNEVKCAGCGICAGICPAKAFQVNCFRDDQILAMIDSVTDTD